MSHYRNSTFVRRCESVQEKIRNLTLKVKSIYGITLPHIAIRFDLKGRCAGRAGRDYNGYYIRINVDMMASDESWNDIIGDTVPHELAHIVCFICPYLGKNHNTGWSRVCKNLGGSGERCHKLKFVYANGKQFTYTLSCGRIIVVSTTRHNRIQKGVVYRTSFGSVLNKSCPYTVTA